MSVPMLAGQASVWVQVNGPNTKPEYLGCHEVGDIAEPLGDITTFYCPDASQAGKFKVSGSYQSEPGVVTTTLSTQVAKTADWLESLKCPGSIFVHKVSCGRRDIFTNYDRSFVFSNARVTNRGLTALAAKNPADEGESMQSFDISAEELIRILAVTAGRQTIGATGDLAAVTFCSTEKCADSCGPATTVCQYGVVVGPNPSASAALWAETWVTEDAGVTWTEAATHPFAAGEDITAVVCFPTSRTNTRILVARGTTDAGAPAEIAYSDDEGATWTLVNVGTTNGQFVNESEGLFALDQYHIWLVTQDGYIYFSNDAGLTWTTQEAGTLAATGWNAIEFVDPDYGYVVGDNNEIATSVDGGTTWTAVVGPAGQAADEVDALAVKDSQNVFIGYSDGEVWYTTDGGATWAERALPVSPTSITDIDFVNDLVGFLSYGIAGPVGGMLRTIDGGYTWESVTMPTNTGLASIHACDANQAFVVGPVTAGLGFIGHIIPA